MPGELMEALAELPLRYRTPAGWAERPLCAPLALLNDHAHLERKAAGNALDLVTRWPQRDPPPYWVERITAIARDEIEHLALVTRLLAQRGGTLTRMHRNPYANALRQRVRHGEGPRETVDRLLVSALIELRSCERFALLAAHCDDAAVRRLFRGLWSSEKGHYLTFLNLAEKVPGSGNVPQCWERWLNYEAEVIAAQPAGPRIHSGLDHAGLAAFE